LEILAPANPEPLWAAIDQLESYDIAIFVSPNSVDRTFDPLRARRAGPHGVRIAAIGRGTARALSAKGVTVDICPTRRFDSEALLALPELAQVRGLRVVVFRGDGGRELLGDTLRQRGAEVVHVEAYRRGRPATDVDALLREWAHGGVDAVTLTSGQALQNLFELVGTPGRQCLLRTPLVVLTERTAELARLLGFLGEVLVADEASDVGLLEALVSWRTGDWAPANGVTSRKAGATPPRGSEGR
jgi:uroporphyrinogen-III synthase